MRKKRRFELNKYLKGVINFLAVLAFGFVGLLFSLNVLVFGFLFAPALMARGDGVLVLNSNWWVSFVPGTLPLFFILTTVCLAALSMYATIYWMKRIDIAKIIVAKKS